MDKTLVEAVKSALFHFWNCDMGCGHFHSSMAKLAQLVNYETYLGQKEEIASWVGKMDWEEEK
jgi:hypothetical protein